MCCATCRRTCTTAAATCPRASWRRWGSAPATCSTPSGRPPRRRCSPARRAVCTVWRSTHESPGGGHGTHDGRRRLRQRPDHPRLRDGYAARGASREETGPEERRQSAAEEAGNEGQGARAEEGAADQSPAREGAEVVEAA